MENTLPQTQTVILDAQTTKAGLVDLFKIMKPGLSPTSLRSYSSTIYNLNIDKKTNKRTFDLNLDNTEQVIEFVRTKDTKSLKTIFSTLNVLTGHPEYKKEMDEENVKLNAIQIEQVKTQTQADNWINYKTIEDIYDLLSDEMWSLLIKYCKGKVPEKDTKRKFTKLKQFLGFLLCSGYYIPPRRNEDYMLLTWDKPEEDHEVVNYIDWSNKQLVFNVYKTSEVYQTQKVDIPKPLLKWLKTYKRIKKNELVFASDIYQKIYTTQGFAHMFHNFFKELPTEHPAHGKRISTRNFRQAYLSNLYKDVPKLADLEKTANNMGHSVAVALKYYVKQSGIPEQMLNSSTVVEIDTDTEYSDPEPDSLD